MATHICLFCEVCDPSLGRVDAPAPPIPCPKCGKLMVLGEIEEKIPAPRKTKTNLKHQDQPWTRGSYDPDDPEDIEQLEALLLASEQGFVDLKRGRTIEFTVHRNLQISILGNKGRAIKRPRYGPKNFTIRWPTKQMIVRGDQLGSCEFPLGCRYAGREKKYGDDPDNRGNDDNATIGGRFKPTIEGINQFEALVTYHGASPVASLVH